MKGQHLSNIQTQEEGLESLSFGTGEALGCHQFISRFPCSFLPSPLPYPKCHGLKLLHILTRANL